MDIIKNILILVSNPTDEDTPEVYNFTEFYIKALCDAGVGAKVRMRRLTVNDLALEQLKPAPDLLVTIGHGSENGSLCFDVSEGTLLDQLPTPYKFSESVSFNDLPKNIRLWFQDIKCILVFACHGSKWLKDQKAIHWIGFADPIFQRPTTALAQRLVKPDYSLSTLLENAKTGDLDPKFQKWIDSSELSHDDPSFYPAFEEGELEFVSASPELLKTYSFASFTHNDGFVGREELLHMLTIPPATDSSLNRQRISWVQGDAGIGKSALLQEVIVRLRNYWFESSKNKPLLICVNLKQEISWEKAVAEIANRIAPFIKMKTEVKRLIKCDKPEKALEQCVVPPYD